MSAPPDLAPRERAALAWLADHETEWTSAGRAWAEGHALETQYELARRGLLRLEGNHTCSEIMLTAAGRAALAAARTPNAPKGTETMSTRETNGTSESLATNEAILRGAVEDAERKARAAVVAYLRELASRAHGRANGSDDSGRARAYMAASDALREAALDVENGVDLTRARFPVGCRVRVKVTQPGGPGSPVGLVFGHLGADLMVGFPDGAAGRVQPAHVDLVPEPAR